ncbi:MAG: HAMP domain-containing protein [Candidatus Omnitrophica bacterium]|nr:HAMP domain-containing protein [Candidatus Omnitrophota bacterium]
MGSQPGDYALLDSGANRSAGYGRIVLSDQPELCGTEHYFGRYPQIAASASEPAADFWPTWDERGWWFCGYAPIRDKSRKVVALLKIDVALWHVLRNLLMHGLIPPAVATLLGLFLASVLAERRCRDITQPLEALASAMNRVSQGDLEQSIETSLEDEIGQITRDFNQMAEALQSGERGHGICSVVISARRSWKRSLKLRVAYKSKVKTVKSPS